ncbi:MAG: permease-like cell division protein FtsX [Gammaproteobacteria bacterium]|nr:permease-like cell division protein FtsX [Gammaproteobacteria bacterium]
MSNSNIRRDKPATSNRLMAYLTHHFQTLLFSLGKIYQAPTTTIMTVAVIGITLSLPAGFYLFLKNIDAMSGDLRSTTQITLYLKLKVAEKEARALQREIDLMQKVQTTEFISRHDALESFRQSSGFGKSIDTLSSNPLPHSIIVEPETGADTFAIKNLLNALQAIPEVDIARLDTEWLERLYTILEIAKRAVAIITILFAFAVLLIIGNTIRLDIQNRYQEIIVTKLIGATNAFIRRPFLYGGVWYGLLGGLTSWIIVEIGYLSISGPLDQLKQLYQADLMFVTFSLHDFIILLSSSTLLGLAGSWIAVARHLNQIEPT